MEKKIPTLSAFPKPNTYKHSDSPLIINHLFN